MKKRKYKILILVILILILLNIVEYGINKMIAEEKIKSYVKISSTYNYYQTPLIYIPSINLKAMIEKANNDFSNLDNSLVYYESFNPSEKVVVFGHSGAGYGTYFNRIDEINNNNKVYVYYQDKVYEYRLFNKKCIDESEVSILKNNEEYGMLYLVTCTKKDKSKRLLIALRLKSVKNAHKIRKK